MLLRLVLVSSIVLLSCSLLPSADAATATSAADTTMAPSTAADAGTSSAAPATSTAADAGTSSAAPATSTAAAAPSSAAPATSSAAQMPSSSSTMAPTTTAASAPASSQAQTSAAQAATTTTAAAATSAQTASTSTAAITVASNATAGVQTSTAIMTTAAPTTTSNATRGTSTTTTPGTTTLAPTTVPSLCSGFTPTTGPMTGSFSLQVFFSGSTTSSPVSISIGGSDCTSITPSTSGFACIAPIGYGSNLITVIVNATSYQCPGYFVYAAPSIDSVTPGRIPAGQSVTVTIAGSFGPVSAAATVQLFPISGIPITLTIGAVRGQSALQVVPPSSLATGVYTLNVTIQGVSITKVGFWILTPSPLISITLGAYADVSQFGQTEATNFMQTVSDIIQDVPAAVYITGVVTGSVVINFLLLTSDTSVSLQTLASSLASGQFRQFYPSALSATVAGAPIIVADPATPAPDDHSNKVPPYAIALIVIFCVIGLLVGLVLWIKVRRRRRREIPLQVVERKDTNMI